MTDKYYHYICTVQYFDLYFPSLLCLMDSEVMAFPYIFSVRILPPNYVFTTAV